MISLFLADETATRQAGNDMAAALRKGDVLALHGTLGAGKTTLARAIIRSLAGSVDLDVPSPTFTLVQTYPGRVPVSHFDLYRIGGPDEVQELGLQDAIADGVALIEWPEHAGEYLPSETIHVKLCEEGEGRKLRIGGPQEPLHRFERSFLIRGFLDEAGRTDAVRGYLTGDASARRYETISSAGGVELLMNAPSQPDGPPIRNDKSYSQIAHLAESVLPFVAIAGSLSEQGLAAPAIRAANLDSGLLLLEDLGREGVLDDTGRPIAARYRAAAELLARVHEIEWPDSITLSTGETHRVRAYDQGALAAEADLLIDWHHPFALGRQATSRERERFHDCWEPLFRRLGHAEASIVLRDYHSPNIIWRGDGSGSDRVGIIDFQDALIGPSVYDVASLAMDARVTISEELERQVRHAYLAARVAAVDVAAFDEAYAIMAAQRNTKILGIFVRLNERDGKPDYLRHLPRIRDYLERATRHPSLTELRALYEEWGVITDAAT